MTQSQKRYISPQLVVGSTVEPTSMQRAAIAVADLPREAAARSLGVRTPQAVSMRLRRARERDGGSRCRMLRHPKRPYLLPVDPDILDRLALSA